MATTVLDMSMSLDGFVAGPNEGPGNGLGDGGERLHEWIFAGGKTDGEETMARPPAADGGKMDEMRETGAVVAGRTTFELANGWGGDHHDGVPIFIYSRREPMPEAAGWPLVTYLDDVTTAIDRAREAAGEGTVLVHGVSTASLALAAGILDELQIHVVPVLLGEGRRLFEGLGPDPVELETVEVRAGRRGHPPALPRPPLGGLPPGGRGRPGRE